MMDATALISAIVGESLHVKSKFFSENSARLAAAAETIAGGLRHGGKVLLFGNGGSAADAQHIATEMVGRFAAERAPLPAISLCTDTSLLTALANDYGVESMFSRQILALGRPGDIAIAISTSGNSKNVLEGLDAARKQNIYTIGLSGETGGQMRNRVDILFCVPSRSTARIQEAHIMIGHVVCDLIERMMFPESDFQD